MLSLVPLDEVVDGANPVSTTPVPAVTIGPPTAAASSSSSSPTQPAVGVHLLSALALPAAVDAGSAALHLAVQVADVPEHLLVAAPRLRVAGEGAVVGEVTCSLLLHQLVLPLLCF